MDKIRPDYIAGYTQALKDAIEAFEAVRSWMPRRQFNGVMAEELLKVMLEHRDAFRDGRGQLRWNSESKQFEIVETRLF